MDQRASTDLKSNTTGFTKHCSAPKVSDSCTISLVLDDAWLHLG